MGLQEQLDDLFRQPADPSGASRRRNFGAKPKLWDAWINPDDEEKHSVNGFTDIKVRWVVRSSPLLRSQPYCCGPYSRSPLYMFRKRQQSPKTRHPLRRRLSTGMIDLLSSWPAFSLTPFRIPATPQKMTPPDLTRPTHLRRYLAEFSFRSSSPCPLQLARNHTPRTPRRKSFQTSLLGSLGFPFPMINVLLTAYFVL